MRCTSAVLLSTLAVGQASAASIHHRHAGFHNRRNGVEKRDSNIDWTKIAVDLKDVDWSKINWSSVFASKPAAAATPTPAAVKPAAVVTTPEAKKETPAPAPTPTPAAASPKVQAAAAPAAPKVDLVSFAAGIAGSMGIVAPVNAKSNNGGIWIGTGSPWSMDVTNSGSDNAVWYCWQSNGFSGMSINKNAPAVAVPLGPGEKQTISFAANVPSACAPAKKGSSLAMFGGLDETWAEVTFGQWGAFDVSRNVNMQGSSISMQGSKCLSDMSTCVFKCSDASAKSCEKGYQLDNCGAQNGGGQGFDSVMQGVGGGCAMGSDGEKIAVSFS